MEKRDIIVIIVAIIIVFIMAMYIKPIVTGKEAKLIPDDIAGLFGSKNNTTNKENITKPDLNNSSSFNQTFVNNTTNITKENNLSILNNTTIINNSLSKPTPVPIWNGTPVTVPTQSKVISGIIPREYPVSSDQRYSFSTPLVPLKTYSTIKGNRSQITDPFYIPSTYWELWYTVELPEDLQNPLMNNSTYRYTTNSVSAVNPEFKIIVTNYDTKNQVTEITPTGGLDPKIWKGLFGNNTTVATVISRTGEGISVNWDPRPWKEKFFEGYHTYQLDILSKYITSYTIEIKLPDPNETIKTELSVNESQINSPGDVFKQKINKFIELYQGDFYNEPNRSALIDLLSSQILSDRGSNDIIKELYYMKLSGVNLTGFNTINTFHRLNEGNVNGLIQWEKNGLESQQNIAINFLNENQEWKMNSLPVIRT